ncbi:hypothetical protein HJC23_009107 [Cyclotella cryptica]|uniref:PTM/DIR17-like Tudor domain-containing protein n=1 Tax=Cyclotella cryptica TaxID=29204 RepID=A0ABD3QYT4_9STRA|eukprot:CCRYP_000730-RA/>CCRYP_000730-RA protein AED:0.01 eAED:0.01 QI:205/1/1/1/1/1/2/216/1565
MPTARRIEIPFSDDSNVHAIDLSAAGAESGRNDGDIADRTHGSDVFVAQRRQEDPVQPESKDEPEQSDVDRENEMPCAKESHKELQCERATQKHLQELPSQTNASSSVQNPNKTVLPSPSYSQYEGPLQRTLHGERGVNDERTDRDANFHMCPHNQNRQQLHSDASTHLASGQLTTTGQVTQNYQRPLEPQRQQNQLEGEFTRNYYQAQQNNLQRKSQTASQMQREECDSNLSQPTTQLSSKQILTLQQKVQSQSQQLFRNGRENQQVSAQDVQQNSHKFDSTFDRRQSHHEHHCSQNISQHEHQQQPHPDEILIQKAQQNLQKMASSLDHPQLQQENQQRQLNSSHLTQRLHPNGFSRDGVPPQEYQRHHGTHLTNSNRNNSSERAKNYQYNYRHQAYHLHNAIAPQNITNHATWQCAKCHRVHSSFIRTCHCVSETKSHSDHPIITNGMGHRREQHQHPGQQQQPLRHQYNGLAKSTAADFQPPTHYQKPNVTNTFSKTQLQNNHYHPPGEYQFNNRGKSTASDFEAPVVEYHQKPMLRSFPPQMTSRLENSASNVNDLNSLSNDNEQRRRTKKVAYRQFRHDFGIAVIDLTLGNEGEGKSASKYFCSNNAHEAPPGNLACFSPRLNYQPNRQGEMDNNQHIDGNDYDDNLQSVSPNEATTSTHNETHTANRTHENHDNRKLRAPKSLTRAIEKATSLPHLEGLRHHLKMMLEKVEDKINRALFEKAVSELDSTNVHAATGQPPSDDDMPCDPNEIRLQRQACCPLCFSFEDTSNMSSVPPSKRSTFSCPICEEANICQDCKLTCGVCKRVCCFDCIKSCDNRAFLYCLDCPEYSTRNASDESTSKAAKEEGMPGKSTVNSMSADVRFKNSRSHSSNSPPKRKLSNEPATKDKRLKTIPSKNAASTQNIPKIPAPFPKTSQLPGSIGETSNDPNSHKPNYEVCHKFIIQHQGKLGIHITADPNNDMGTIISRVEEGSPADIYGLKTGKDWNWIPDFAFCLHPTIFFSSSVNCKTSLVGDRIVHHDENPNVKISYTLTRDWLMDRLKKRPISISVLRRCIGDDSERHIIYALDSTGGKRPLHFEDDGFCASIHRFVFNDDGGLGISLSEWPTGKGYSYTIVTHVESGSLAETHGIRKGDIISKPTEAGRLVTGLSQWITTKIHSKPPFRFEILRLHKVKNNELSRNGILESQPSDSSKIRVLPKESNVTKNQNATSLVENENTDQAAASYLSNDSKRAETNASDLLNEPISEQPIPTEPAHNSDLSEETNVQCSENKMDEIICIPDPCHLDEKPINHEHRVTDSGKEVGSSSSMSISRHEKTKDILPDTDTNELHSYQTVLDNPVYKSKPTYTIGTKLWKKFLDDNGKRRPFQGTIESYDPDEGFYKIVYEDGDEEELTESQVSKLLQKNKKTTDENRPLLIGKLSLVEKDGKCLHSIRGHWYFEKHHRIPSQTFELLRKEPPDEVVSTEPLRAANGEYYGSFVYEWKDPNTKERLTAVIKESNVVIEFVKEGREGEVFSISGKGINQYGIFELNGLASKDTKSSDTVYDIRMNKTYLKPNTAN